MPSPRAFFYALLLLLPVFTRAQQSHKVRLLCQWTDTAAVPVNSRGHRYNEVWGFTANGKEYGVIGSSVGAHVIDVNTCRQVVFAPGATGNASHRDYKIFGSLLYAISEDGMSTLQIFDTRYLPDSLQLVYESDPRDISRAHKLFIDTLRAKLYLPSFTNQTTGHDFMRVYSLQRPDSPVLQIVYNENADVHDVFVRDDTAYCSSSFDGYHVLDCSQPPAGHEIGLLTNYPYKGFNHSSWVGPDGIGVMADETFGSPLKVIDTRHMDRIRVLSTFSPRGLDSTSVPHNPFILGRYVYVSYYMDGLQIYDLSDPAHPRQAGWYHTYTGGYYQGYAGAWGCYPYLPSGRVLVSDMQTGFYVLDADEAVGRERNLQFAVCPNPATDRLQLLLPDTVGGTLRCVIYDLLGRTVLSRQILLNDRANPPVELPLPPHWPGGMYLLRVFVGDQLYTARFIKL